MLRDTLSVYPYCKKKNRTVFCTPERRQLKCLRTSHCKRRLNHRVIKVTGQGNLRTRRRPARPVFFAFVSDINVAQSINETGYE